MCDSEIYGKPKSLVIGFCICAKCGWTDNKFNWHTYFKCPECGSSEYVKEGFNEQKGNEKGTGVVCNDDTNSIFFGNNVLYD